MRTKRQALEAALKRVEQEQVLTRSLQVERGVVDMETGRFPMILATEGEASDGHILSIEGIETQDRMPMLFGHRSEATNPVLGSVVEPVKDLSGSVPVLRQTGVFNLQGDGPLAAIRRDIAQLVDDGDLSAVSIRWDGLEWTRRINLPADHPYFVDANEVDFDDERYWGVFFSRSRSVEGSVVAIGADPGAVSGRAQATNDPASRVFLQALASTMRADERSDHALGDLTTAMEALRQAYSGLEALGVSREETALMVAQSDTEYGFYRGFAVPKTIADECLARDEALLDYALDGRDQGTAAQAESALRGPAPSPEGDPPSPREVDEAPKHAEGTVGAMDPDDLFRGIGAAVGKSVGTALERVTGRR